MDRRAFLTSGATALAIGAASGESIASANLGLLVYSYGYRARAEKARGFSEPLRFLTFARERGANAVQLPLGSRPEAEGIAIRRAADRLGMHVEGIVSPPAEGKTGLERFAGELATARACGAGVVRMVMLGGRRYEVFDKADDYPAFARRAEEALERAAPVAEQHRVVLAVENHKDFRLDELLALLKRLASEWIGVCLDTGNNLALLDDPLAVVEALAPYTRTVHLKDIGVEESADGFRMAEVPLGQGAFDLKRMVAAVRKASPRARFQLEMMTRDPLAIPCLGERYWATLDRVPGRDLARTLAFVRRSTRKTPLPRISALAPAEQLAAEERHVRESFAFAARTRLIPD